MSLLQVENSKIYKRNAFISSIKLLFSFKNKMRIEKKILTFYRE